MQDGTRGTSKGLYICTDSFTHADVQRLCQYLSNKYDIKCSIHKSGGNYRIYILAKSVETSKNSAASASYRPVGAARHLALVGCGKGQGDKGRGKTKNFLGVSGRQIYRLVFP